MKYLRYNYIDDGIQQTIRNISSFTLTIAYQAPNENKIYDVGSTTAVNSITLAGGRCITVAYYTTTGFWYVLHRS